MRISKCDMNSRYPHVYTLDDHHVFEKDRPVLVCGNSASMVGESWLAPHFRVEGERSHHFGLFPCGPAPTTSKTVASQYCSADGAMGCC